MEINIDNSRKNENQDKKVMNHLFNPSNNTFAFIAYQKWINLKKLQLENDKMFTRCTSSLYLCLSKYFLSSLFVVYATIIINSNDRIFIHFLILSNLVGILSYFITDLPRKMMQILE